MAGHCVVAMENDYFFYFSLLPIGNELQSRPEYNPQIVITSDNLDFCKDTCYQWRCSWTQCTGLLIKCEQSPSLLTVSFLSRSRHARTHVYNVTQNYGKKSGVYTNSWLGNMISILPNKKTKMHKL